MNRDLGCTDSIDVINGLVPLDGHTVVSSVIPEPPTLDASITMAPITCTEIGQELGKRMVKNVVALGALQAATGLFPREHGVGLLLEQAPQRIACEQRRLDDFAQPRGERDIGERGVAVIAQQRVRVAAGAPEPGTPEHENVEVAVVVIVGGDEVESAE